MHCMELRTATLRLVARHRTMAWQSDPNLLVSAPTSSRSKNSTGCRISASNTCPLRHGASRFVSKRI